MGIHRKLVIHRVGLRYLRDLWDSVDGTIKNSDIYRNVSRREEEVQSQYLRGRKMLI